MRRWHDGSRRETTAGLVRGDGRCPQGDTISQFGGAVPLNHPAICPGSAGWRGSALETGEAQCMDSALRSPSAQVAAALTFYRKADEESGAFTGLAGNTDLPAVGFDEAPRNSKTQAAAFLTAGGAGAAR